MFQLDQFESEIESLLAGKKKRLDKDKQDRMDELKVKLERHRHHIRKLETLLRMLDNMSVEVSQVSCARDPRKCSPGGSLGWIHNRKTLKGVDQESLQNFSNVRKEFLCVQTLKPFMKSLSSKIRALLVYFSLCLVNLNFIGGKSVRNFVFTAFQTHQLSKHAYNVVKNNPLREKIWVSFKEKQGGCLKLS